MPSYFNLYVQWISKISCKSKIIIYSSSVTCFYITLFFCFCTSSSFAQKIKLPTAYYSLQSNAEKADYLKALIKYSVAQGNLSSIPEREHLAISLIGSNQTDTLLPWLHRYLGDAWNFPHCEKMILLRLYYFVNFLL